MSSRNVLLVVSLVLSVIIGMVWSRGTGSVTAAGSPASGPAKDGKIRIGLSLDTLKEARWQRDRDLFVARAKTLGAEVSVQSANSDDTVQMRDCESLIASRVDVLVIAPHDGLAMAKAVEKAKAAGIPVIAYDRLIRNADIDVYTSFDNVEVGRMQSRYLVERLRGKGNIVRIYGAPTDNNARLFKAGQDEVLKPYIERGDITVVHEDWAEDWKPENAKRITSAAITKGARFVAVLASNDGTAGGAIQALEEEKLTDVLVTGQDAELPACQRIAAGTQAMTIYKPLGRLASDAAELAVKLARREVAIVNGSVENGKKTVPALLVPVLAVDAKNLLETIVKDGFHPYDDVYRAVPNERRPPRP
ncbi:MAG: substrate-binding domain-containing protein [Polyangiaceae bacterium]